jgi:CBS domain-containing protein
MKVHEIMTAHARCVGPDNTLVEAAGLMRELDVGALPVCEGNDIQGIVTDRDLVVRGTADGKDPNTTSVREVMSTSVVSVFAEQEVEEAVRLMESRQIRRVPVLNRDRRLVGIVSLGDIAISSNPAFSGMALRDVSEPRRPTARQRRLAERSRPNRMPQVPGATTTEKRRTAGRRTKAAGAQSKSAPGAASKGRLRKSTAKTSTSAGQRRTKTRSRATSRAAR